MTKKYKRYDFKVAFLDSIFRECENKVINVLDMGGGTSKDFVEILKNYQNIHYTSIELNKKDLEKAKNLLNGYDNVEFLCGLGEDAQQAKENFFDITLSLSVLEHVKNLEEFLRVSCRVTRQGGKVIHRYDLGHSLHSSFYERSKVFMCNHLPFLFPASRFTCHPKHTQVTEVMKSEGVEVKNIIYGQMSALKRMMNQIRWEEEGAWGISSKIIELDNALSKYFKESFPTSRMEYYFPTVTVVGIKR